MKKSEYVSNNLNQFSCEYEYNDFQHEELVNLFKSKYNAFLKPNLIGTLIFIIFLVFVIYAIDDPTVENFPTRFLCRLYFC